MREQTTYYSTPGMQPTTVLVPETDEEIAQAWEHAQRLKDLEAEQRQIAWEAGQPARDAEEMAVDITDRELWVRALDMACGEGVMGYIVRDRMIDYFDLLVAHHDL